MGTETQRTLLVIFVQLDLKTAISDFVAYLSDNSQQSAQRYTQKRVAGSQKHGQVKRKTYSNSASKCFVAFDGIKNTLGRCLDRIAPEIAPEWCPPGNNPAKQTAFQLSV